MNTYELHQALAASFEVHQDDDVLRIVTPLEYLGTGDHVVVRIRPTASGYVIDENGEAAFHASAHGGDVDSDAVRRWAAAAEAQTHIRYADETLSIASADERLIATGILHVAAAAQQLFTIAAARNVGPGVELART